MIDIFFEFAGRKADQIISISEITDEIDKFTRKMFKIDQACRQRLNTSNTMSEEQISKEELFEHFKSG